MEDESIEEAKKIKREMKKKEAKTEREEGGNEEENIEKVEKEEDEKTERVRGGYGEWRKY